MTNCSFDIVKDFSPFTFHFSRKRCAFTLSEVLITLGIIGVVAAITMPALISKHKKNVVVNQLKANYSIFSQVIENSKRDNGDFSNWPKRSEMTPYDFEEHYILPYLENPKEVKGHVVYALQKAPKSGSQQSLYWFYNSSRHFYQIANGAVFSTGLHSIGDNRYIIVDINGSKSPNIMGKDVFVFNIDYANNKFTTHGSGLPLGNLLADSCEYNYWGACNFCEGNGYAGNQCASVIVLSGWQITDDYPW